MTLLLATAGLATLTGGPSTAAPAAEASYWKASSAKPTASRAGNPARVSPEKYAGFALQRGRLAAKLAQAPLEGSDADGVVVSVPAPNGDLVDFVVKESPIMEHGLAVRHPEITTYAGRAVKDATATIRLDLTPDGFHASVRGSAGTAAWYVDPAWTGDDSLYLSYRLRDLPAAEHDLVEPDEMARELSKDVAGDPGAGEAPGAEVSLRTYRLAFVTDQSYAAYFGTGNVLTEKVILMNRVNHIYNDDLAIRMVLVDGTDDLNLDTDAKAIGANGPCGSAPCFTEAQLASCTGGLLNRNRIVIGQIIGASHYDIGHIGLGKNGGGVAGLGVVGGDGKARGCTGLPTPQGDFFAIDYVAHEMGHQFGGPHTFNGTQLNCSGGNRSAGASVEPGSGSSVMAYAGICQQDNTQPHTDPYFSQRSITNITDTVLPVRPPINEVQNVALSGFDTDGDSFTLTIDGQTTAEIVRGVDYTAPAVDAAIEAVTGAGTVVVANFGGGGAPSDQGFQVTFNGAPLAGTDVGALTVNGVAGDVTGFAGETARGGPIFNGGSEVTPTGNHAPVVTVPEGKQLPLRTPFALTGEATDADGDQLTYLWEQNDRGGSPGTALGAQAKVNGPLFRVFGESAQVTPAGTLEIESPGENIATGDPTRIFPDLAQVLGNNTNALTGECPAMPPVPPTSPSNVPLPTVECFAEWLPTASYLGDALAGNTEPSLNFRLTARDGAPEGGGTAYGDVKLTLAAGTGPFRVTSKSAVNAVAYGGRTEPISWSVAGTNTPALAENVKITLSTNGGETFPYVLAESTPNDGLHSVTWPNVETTHGRLKVEAVDNYFFDLNDADITIIAGLTLDGPSAVTATVGQPLTPAPTFEASTIAADGDQITATATGLPAGLSLTAGATSADGTRPGTASWQLTGTPTGPAGTHEVTITAADGSNEPTTHTLTITLVKESTPPQTTITSGPAEGGVVTRLPVTLGFASSETPATYVCTLAGAPLPCADGSVTLAAPAAGTHTFTVAARDAAGNLDPTPATRVFTVPVDDKALTKSGKWRSTSAPEAFGGSFITSSKKGSTLKLKVKNATGIRLLVNTGRKYGPVTVSLGGKTLGKVKTDGPGKLNVVKKVATFSSPRSGWIKLKVKKNSPVVITGVVVYDAP